MRLVEDFDKPVELQKIEYRVDKRFDLKDWPFLSYEMQVDKERSLGLLDFDPVDDPVVEIAARFAAGIAHLSSF